MRANATEAIDHAQEIAEVFAGDQLLTVHVLGERAIDRDELRGRESPRNGAEDLLLKDWFED